MQAGQTNRHSRGDVPTIKRPDHQRSMATLRELQQEWRRAGLPADPQGIAALHLAITFGEIDLYRSASLTAHLTQQPVQHVYNVWDYARQERVEVEAWLARQPQQTTADEEA